MASLIKDNNRKIQMHIDQIAAEIHRAIHPGDEVQVQGPEIMAPFGEIVSEERDAIILRASTIERLWTKATGDLEVMELCEFSFSEEVTL